MQSQELEQYLRRLDLSLGEISVSEKAEIITEIKSHVVEAIQNDPTQSVSSVLKSLGEPEQVASRYLLERGLKPQQAPRHPVLKWLVIGFLGTIVTGTIGIIFLVSQFMPLIHVDEKLGRVQILGGLIDVNSDLEKLEIGGVKLGDFEEEENVQVFAGTEEIGALKAKTLTMAFTNGKVNFKKGEDLTFRYSCKVSGGETNEIFSKSVDKGLSLDLSKSAYSSCSVTLPFGVKTVVDGKNGKVALDRPQGDFKLNLLNGKVSIRPDEKTDYNYNLTVVNGKIDGFHSKNSQNAIAIEASVINGAIKKR